MNNPFSLFINRDDDYAIQRDDGKYYRTGEPITTGILQKHLLGNTTIGVYYLDKEGFVKWICWDFDGDIKEQGKKAVELFKKLEAEGMHPLIEFSGRKGWHVWIFIERIEVRYAYAYGRKMAEGFDCEVFPKQKEDDREFGNLVKIPLGVHKVSGKRSYFLDPKTLEPLNSEGSLKLLENWPIDTIPKIEIVEPVYVPTVLENLVKKPIPKETEMLVKNGVGEGDRNATRYAIFNKLKYRGWSDDEILVALLKFNNNCRPPNDESKVKAHWKQMAKDWVPQIIEEKEEAPKTTIPQGEKEEEVPKIKVNVDIRNFFTQLKDDEGNVINQFHKFLPKAFSNFLMKQIVYKTTDDIEMLYYWNDAVYHRDGADVSIKKQCEEILGEHINRNQVNEVVGHIKRSTYASRELFNAEPHLLNMKNGVFNLLTGELLPHDPDRIFTFQLPVEYNPNTDCPKWNNFLSEILYPQDIPFIQEYVGFGLYRKYSLRKFLILWGIGGNGKTTFIGVLEKFYGIDNISHVGLQQFGENTFAGAELYGKLMNIKDEVPKDPLKYVEKINELTGGGTTRAETKGKDAFYFQNSAKLLFACNVLPDINDASDAFWDRATYLTFPYKFIATPNSENADEKKLRDREEIVSELTTPDELSGIFNWAYEGLKRLRTNNAFTGSLSSEEAKRLYKMKSDATTAFKEERLYLDAKNEIEKNKLYAEYAKYCMENRLPALGYQAFCRKFKDMMLDTIGEAQPKLGDGRTRVWVGVALKKQVKCELCKENQYVQPEIQICALCGGKLIELDPKSGENGEKQLKLP